MTEVLTTDPRNRPVTSNAGGNGRQLKDEGPGIWVNVVIGGSDVDTVDVSAHPLADLGLLGYEGRGVVINIYQIDLQRACATGYGRAWEQSEEKENNIRREAGEEQDVNVTGEKEEGQVPRGKQ